VKLSCNFISKGRYFRAFVDDVPDELVPAHIAEFAITEDEKSPIGDARNYQKDLADQQEQSDHTDNTMKDSPTAQSSPRVGLTDATQTRDP
jgi:hypothetical protein